MTQSHLTKKQQAIIKLIYRYRFVDRKQLQALMQLKDKKRLSVWLKDLRDQHYVEWIYSTDFLEKTKPAVYYLGTNGIRFLRGLGEYPQIALHKRYKESLRTLAFIIKSRLLVDCALDMAAKTNTELTYTVSTQADYANPKHHYHFLKELNPDLHYQRTEQTTAGSIVKDYLVVIFDVSMPRYMTRKFLKEYVAYIDGKGWKRHFDGTELIVHIACQTTSELIYAKRRTRLLMSDTTRDTYTHIRFTTVEQLRLHGVTGIIWEEV